MDWGLSVFLSEENKHLITRDMFPGRDVEIIILPFDKFSVDGYNKLLTSSQFWDCLEYDKVLIFQTDSRILRSGIEEFLHFDYMHHKKMPLD